MQIMSVHSINAGVTGFRLLEWPMEIFGGSLYTGIYETVFFDG
jgi:hypothetical protein